jgi:tRNA pseudouridine55 synthase
MGVYVVDKPLGLTSFDVVAAARRALGTRRIGHTGTLDPLATGVLVVAAGESTKLVQFLTGVDKDYLALVSFGAATATLDAEGPVLEESTATLPDKAALEEALASLRGPQMQLPPAHSAIQVDGVRAYAAARQGKPLELEPRPVTVHALDLLGSVTDLREAAALRFRREEASWRCGDQGRAFSFPPALGRYPTVVLGMTVSSGTYIRSLARDIGERLGMPAYLSGLVRTRVGAFTIEQAVPPQDLEGAAPVDDLAALDMPTLELDERSTRDVRDGKRLPSSLTGLVALTHGGNLVAVAEGDGRSLRVRRGWT